MGKYPQVSVPVLFIFHFSFLPIFGSLRGNYSSSYLVAHMGSLCLGDVKVMIVKLITWLPFYSVFHLTCPIYYLFKNINHQ